MYHIGIQFLQGCSIFIAAINIFVFVASGYVPALLVAIWACMLVWWCRELILEDDAGRQRR